MVRLLTRLILFKYGVIPQHQMILITTFDREIIHRAFIFNRTTSYRFIWLRIN